MYLILYVIYMNIKVRGWVPRLTPKTPFNLGYSGAMVRVDTRHQPPVLTVSMENLSPRNISFLLLSPYMSHCLITTALEIGGGTFLLSAGAMAAGGSLSSQDSQKRHSSLLCRGERSIHEHPLRPRQCACSVSCFTCVASPNDPVR